MSDEQVQINYGTLYLTPFEPLGDYSKYKSLKIDKPVCIQHNCEKWSARADVCGLCSIVGFPFSFKKEEICSKCYR